MKSKIVIIIIIAFSIVSCSSSKETNRKLTKAEISATEKATNNQLNQELTNKVNKIIQNYLGVPISSIARSDVRETAEGYQWKFMNVKTGENFIANSDFSFNTVKITKNKRS